MCYFGNSLPIQTGIIKCEDSHIWVWVFLRFIFNDVSRVGVFVYGYVCLCMGVSVIGMSVYGCTCV